MAEAIILSQGNELTTGQTVDTNANWLCGELWAMGIDVRRVVTVPDRLDDLVAVMQDVAPLARWVVCTGGLGPTRDDLTAEAIARACGVGLALRDDALEQVKARYAAYNRVMNEANIKQAILPEGSTVMENHWGTAPGFFIDLRGCRFYFMPGVPREMKPMFAMHVAADIRATLDSPPPVTHSVRVFGKGESELEELLRGFDDDEVVIGFRTKLPENQVKLRFAAGVTEARREELLQDVLARIGPGAWTVDGGDLADVVGAELRRRGDTLALAESCTAGQLAGWFGEKPGASAFLLEGAVVYSNAAKVRSAGVDPALIDTHGAVSEPVARALAEGIRARAGATWGIGITGIAGPDGGSPDKPVGTVHLAVAGPDGTTYRAARFPGDRHRVQSFACATALHMLRKELGLGVDRADRQK